MIMTVCAYNLVKYVPSSRNCSYDLLPAVAESFANIFKTLDKRIVGNSGFTPHSSDQLVLTDQPAVIFGEIFKDVKGFRAELYLLTAAVEGTAREVEAKPLEEVDLVSRMPHTLTQPIDALLGNFRR
jgi:hypothetical protein